MSVILQHANEDVEKMILGNKCDMENKRQVSKDRGEAVSVHMCRRTHICVSYLFNVECIGNRSDGACLLLMHMAL